MERVERLQHTNAWARRHPGEKVLLGGGLLLLSMGLPVVPGAPLILAAAVAAVLLFAGVSPADYGRVLAAPLAFLLTGALGLAIVVNPAAGAPWLAVTAQSAGTAAAVSLRALAAVASLLVIVLTVPLNDLLRLAQRAHLPAPILDITLMMYRFIGLIMGVAGRMRLAQANRLGYAGARVSIRSTGMLAASLLPRVLDRARRMETGLAARAYCGELRTLPVAAAPSRRFIVAVTALLAAIAAACLAATATGAVPALPA
jgi:cobalt/nickel transport system permease protein